MPEPGGAAHQQLTSEEALLAGRIGPVARLDGPVHLDPYDERWPVLYDREESRIRTALGTRVVAIEHVGSTAVPSLAAKPRIDIVLVVADSADEASYVPWLEAAGYRLRGREPEWHEHRRFKGPDTDVNLDTEDDFLAAIGYGAVSAQQVVTRLGVVDDAELTLPAVAPPQQVERTGGVRVKGVGDLLVRFAGCCHPIPGDPIVGFITRGKGVTVHLRTCPTVVNEREVNRLVEVEWEAAPAQTYPIALTVEAYDRTGLLNDITQVVAEHKVNIVAASVSVSPDHTASVRITLQVQSVAQLARVMGRIEGLKDVTNVSRDLS